MLWLQLVGNLTKNSQCPILPVRSKLNPTFSNKLDLTLLPVGTSGSGGDQASLWRDTSLTHSTQAIMCGAKLTHQVNAQALSHHPEGGF